jgi:hypothetical protein
MHHRPETIVIMTSLFEQPEIDFLVLADRAEAVNGKLYMMGGAWDRLQLADFSQPAVFSIALSVLVPWSSTNEDHPLHIFIESEDGTRLAQEVQINVNVGRPPNAIRGQSFRALIALNGAWSLPGPGTYRVVATLAGQEPKRTVFYVAKAT